MERNTQFSKFADGVVQELMSVHDGAMQASEWWQEQASKIIAKRAYDLALHVMAHLADLEPKRTILFEHEHQAYLREILSETVPDLTELPEVSK